MAPPELPHDASDESFLDRLFERAVAALEEGHSLSVSELLDGREDLRHEVERLVLDARSVACVRPEELPRVPGYTVIEELGRGGMGAVYLARQDALGGRRVALKLLPAAASASARSRTRFLNEARTLASVRHPNVVTVHDVIESDVACAYAMEWVDGASLSQLIQRARSTSPADRAAGHNALSELLTLEPARSAEPYSLFVCRVGLAVARALAALHRAGLVHRDVKPSNVLLRRDGTTLLSDFGLVQSSEPGLTKTGEFVGTVLYASPEQLEGESERLDARSDIYSLGVTLYQALTLRLPFDEASADSKRPTTPTGMLRLIESRSAVPLCDRDRSLPRDLETIVATAIDTDPARRYASADELADDLERLLSLQPIHARPASLISRAAKFVRRNRSAARGLIVGSAASIALALLAVVCFFFAPRWFDEHVREARLALLDPIYANALFVREQFEVPASATRTLLTDDGLRRALASYEAALRWSWFDRSIDAEREVVARALDHEAPEVAAADPRLAGLGAYLAGDVDGALEHWSEAERLRDPRAAADPLVEAMLGVLLLVRDEPARAYPRLREACRMFPDVGFLATYHADAAVRCGDYETAGRLLESAREMPRLDPLGAHERVTADLYAATGRDEDAERLYDQLRSTPIAQLHCARFLAKRGRLDQAVERYVAALQSLTGENTRREYRAALETWWSSLTDAERTARIAATLDLPAQDPRSLVARLRGLGPVGSGVGTPGQFRFFATLRRWRSSPPLQSLELAELAQILEVHDMNRWNEIARYPDCLRPLQMLAWRSPVSRASSRVVRTLADGIERSATRAAVVASIAAGHAALANAQTCTGAPCFQGLGDLPGGAFHSVALCLSSDGTCVGGGSTGALSNGPAPYTREPFRWRADTGMVYLGDLPGHFNAGEVQGLSSDGSVAVGWSSSALGDNTTWNYPYGEAFRWTESGGMSGLGDIPAGHFYSEARKVSDDGAFIAGIGSGTGPWSSETLRSVTWSSATGWVVQGGSSTLHSSFFALSRNGQWAVGRRITSPADTGGYQETVRWSSATGLETVYSVPYINGGVSSGVVPLAVTDDGRTLVGYDNFHPWPALEAFLWSDSTGLQTLPDLPGGAVASIARAITRDGALVVGTGTSASGVEAVLWDEQRALHRLAQYLECRGVTIPLGWTLSECFDVVLNAGVLTFCGYGTNPSGNTEAWIARCLRWPLPNSYCTAGTTTNGCNATMSASGTPSVASTSGFTLACSNVEGQKSGLIFYGVNGPNAALWAPGSSSFLCVKSPVQRTASANSGGTAGACDGSFSLDFLSYLATHPGALGQPFAAGACVNVQTWFRDPPAPGTTNLSNALQFTTAP